MRYVTLWIMIVMVRWMKGVGVMRVKFGNVASLKESVKWAYNDV